MIDHLSYVPLCTQLHDNSPQINVHEIMALTIAAEIVRERREVVRERPDVLKERRAVLLSWFWSV